MRNDLVILIAVLSGLVVVSAGARADDRSDDIARIDTSRELFRDLMKSPDKAIPSDLLRSAKCLAFIPGEKKAGFIVGGQYGKGLAMCRTAHGWSAPVFVKLERGSVGFQAGAASTDLVLVFRNREGFQRLLNDKFKIGADATAAPGPVVRNAEAATDLEMHAEILTYSRSRGVFGGVSLNGTVVKPDPSGDTAMYGNADRTAIVSGKVAVPKAAESLIAEIERYPGVAHQQAMRTSTH